MWALLLVSSIFLTVAHPTAGMYYCPTDFQLYEGYCYFKGDTKLVTWDDARKKCQDRSTSLMPVDLASILSESESTFVGDTMQNISYFTYWIGMRKPAGGRNDAFYWVDGMDSTFRKWHPGQPSNNGGIEDCVQVYGGNGRYVVNTWNDDTCHETTSFYVCKGKAYTKVTTKGTTEPTDPTTTPTTQPPTTEIETTTADHGFTVEITPGDTQITKRVGSSVVLECSARGVHDDVIPHVTWYANGNKVSEHSRVFVRSTSVHSKKLYMFDIGDTDRGTYWCEVSCGGDVVRRAVSIVVFKDITFDHAPQTQNPWFESDALIQCEVSGDPAPTVWWRKQGKVIKSGGRYVYEPAGLRIYNITRADTGLYTCVAEVAAEGRVKETLITVIVRG